MKAKVLMYKADYNTLCTKTVELEKVTEHVYKMPVKGCDTVSRVVFDVKGILFTVMMTNNNVIDAYKDRMESDCMNFVDKIRGMANSGEYIRSIEIRVFECLGLSTDELIKAREVFKEKKKEEERQKEIQHQERKRKEEERRNCVLDKVNDTLVNGGWISCGDFLALCERSGIKMHPRTKHLFNRNITMVSKGQGLKYIKYTGERKPDFTGCHNVIEKYLLKQEEVIK